MSRSPLVPRAHAHPDAPPDPASRRSRRLAWSVALAVAACSFVVANPPAGASAATDEAGFRTAYEDANETAISLGADITLTCAGGGAPVRASSGALEIIGNGHTLTQSCANSEVGTQNGAGALMIHDLHVVAANGSGFRSMSSGSVLATDVTITGASGSAFQLREGPVELQRVVITGFGRGVETNGEVFLDHTRIEGTLQTGVESGGLGQVDIRYSTITGSAGTGVVSDSGPLLLLNSTVSDHGRVGVFTDRAPITLVYSTVVANATGSEPGVGGGNITSVSGSVTSMGSVVASTSDGSTNCDIGSNATSSFSFDDDGSCSFAGATDHGNGGDPQLGALQDNGGFGRTRLPAPTSPLLDLIPPAECGFGAFAVTDDERDAARPAGAGCDIGAVELGAEPPASTTTTTTAVESTTTTSTAAPGTPPVTSSSGAATAVRATPAFTG